MKTTDKDYYESLIDESPLFEIDRDCDPVRFQTESFRMVDYLYRYLMAINASKYEKYGLEIVETAGVCIRNYDKSIGRFINYFNYVWHQAFINASSNELIDENYKGMKMSERQRRAYKKYKNYCNITGKDRDDIVNDLNAAEVLGMTIDEFKTIKMLDENKVVSIYSQSETDDSGYCDQIASDTDFVKELFITADNELFIDHIEKVYLGLQDRQKPMIAMLITSALSLEMPSEDLLFHFKRKAFFDSYVYAKCMQEGRPLKNKDIAECFGVDEASVSRSWRRFKEKLDSKDFAEF